eukprot:CAMPEP_0181180726 /NCGR_PEP_ID=MMETSP1096-20121128/6954_1 /TAXON_ID=156174 ORGANISM="Chrysochromulina ericina, Strain CCMP281" /NCGR_SAMPLE_ID=MMETSP1096 /ASSEMBLY_ACC=CAM_ASM_000453 /LENGTH=66 /DNA_ID=CAMNT_0023269175 /DNA_START=12 /DNA_END=212 /DNA_ORIENTATION=+
MSKSPSTDIAGGEASGGWRGVCNGGNDWGGAGGDHGRGDGTHGRGGGAEGGGGGGEGLSSATMQEQ